MQLDGEIISAHVVKVYNSLILDIRLENGAVVPALCSAPESLELCTPGTEVLVLADPSPLRKIKHKLVFINRAEGPVFVDQSLTRRIFREGFENGVVKELTAYHQCREIEVDDHLFHIDFELTDDEGGKCFVFLKNLYFKYGSCTVFPQAVNFYEIEMFEEMARLRAAGHLTMVVMIVPRMDCMEARFSWKYDPIASARLFEEAKNGLPFVCYGCHLDKNSVTLAKNMAIVY